MARHKVSWAQVPGLDDDEGTPAWVGPLALAVAVTGPAVRAWTVHGRSVGLFVVLAGAVASLAIAARPGRSAIVRLCVVAAAGLVVGVVAGRVTGAWLAAALVVADWGVRGRAPVRWLPPADDATVPAVVGLSALAVWVGREPDARLPLVLVVAATFLAITVGAVFPDRVRRAVRAVSRVVGSAVDAVGFSIVAVPVVLVPWAYDRLAGIDPLHRSDASWSRRRESAAEAKRLYRHESRGRGSGGGGLRRFAATAVVLLVIVGATALVVRILSSSDPGPHQNTDPDATPAAFAAARWYPEYLEDISWLWNTDIAWDPLAPVRLRDVSTRHINIVDGARVSWKAPPCDECPRYEVWMYGGSTTFGLGQRDEHTIASALARAAWRDGIVLDVVNRGVVGDTHWEEAQRLGWDLATLPPPDLVIFLDGINDTQSIERLRSRTRQPVGIVKEDFWANYLANAEGIGMDSRWAPSGDVRNRPSPPGASLPVEEPFESNGAVHDGAEIARRYELARRISADLARVNGVPVVWFWQPAIWHRDPAPGEPAAEGREWALERDRAARDRIGDDVVDVTGAFDGHRKPLFWDTVHTNEEGARLVAEAAYPSVRAALESLTVEPS